MIKLIKNELFKIFHKLSTYIILLIALIFVVITNAIYCYYDELNGSYIYYEDVDIDEVNNYINNYDPETDSLEDYAYNLALLDVYNLSSRYDKSSWQYQAFMNNYLNLDIEYYIEMHQSESDSAKISSLNEEMLLVMQAIYNDDWKYFVNEEKETLEASVANYEDLLETDNLSDSDRLEYNKMLYISREQLELVNYRLDEDIAFGDDYLNQTILDIENNLYAMADYLYDGDINPDDYEDIVKEHYENEYILEEKIDTKSSDTLRSVIMNFFTEYSFLIIVFVIMIAGSIVSDEFNKGTIKSLLTVPHERTSILWSKYLTVLLTIPIIIIFLFLMELLVGGIFMGFDSLSIPAVIYNISTKSIEILNVFSYFLVNLLANLPQIILLATLAFACSVILNSTAFAITLTFCGMIASEIINSFAYLYDIKILNYFVTTNWDMTVYLFGGHSIYGVTMGHSLLICLTYLVIMLIVAFVVFIRRDVKNI